MDNVNDASSANSASQSSDMSFYVIMLAIIVGMAFYISYDMEQRYGTSADNSSSIAVEPEAAPVTEAAAEPVAEIPATETTPEAVVVEKTEQKTVVTTAVVPFNSGVIVIPAAEKAKTEEAKVKAAAPVVSEKVVEKTVSAPAPAALPIVDSMIETVEIITAPAVEAVEVVTEAVQSAPEAIPAPQAASPAYNPYDNPYGNPYGNPYQGYQQPQQQPQYGNPYGNPYNNPYNNYNSNPYNNPYANPYGNPYQQPAAQPAQ